MQVVSGLFDSSEAAHAAVAALEEAGVASDQISIVGPDDDAAAGAGTGAAIGATGGLLAGLAAFAIPGIGPAIGAGWLIGGLAGAAAGGVAGGVIGALTGEGIEERDAHVYAEGIRRGGTMVIARVDDSELDPAVAILNQHGRAEIGSRRRIYVGRLDRLRARDPRPGAAAVSASADPMRAGCLSASRDPARPPSGSPR